jgi:hypothetical protein
MPEPAQPGRARVWAGALDGDMQAQARQRVKSWRRVGMVIVLLRMLREFADDWRESFCGGMMRSLAIKDHSMH